MSPRTFNSIATLITLLLAAGAVLAGPAAAEAEALADDSSTHAVLAEDADEGQVVGLDRSKKQTTTVCIQVAPARGGEMPRVLCGDPQLLEAQQRLLQTPAYRPESGFFGPSNVVQIRPAFDTVAVDAAAPIPARADSVVLSPSILAGPAGPSTFTIMGNFRNADGEASASVPSPSGTAGTGPATPAPAATAANAAAAPTPASVFSAAPTNAQEHASQAQARSFGQEDIRWQTGPGFHPIGLNGPSRVFSVDQGPYGTEIDVLGNAYNQHLGGGNLYRAADPASPGNSQSPPASIKPDPVPAPAHQTQPRSFGAQQITTIQHGYGDMRPLGLDGMAEVSVMRDRPLHSMSQIDVVKTSVMQPGPLYNFRSAEPGASHDNQPASLRASQDGMKPLVFKKQVSIPAVVAAPVPTTREATLAELLNPFSPNTGFGQITPLSQPPPLLPQRYSPANIPITLNCDLSRAAYSGVPQAQQLQLKLMPMGLPSVLTAARSAESDQTHTPLDADKKIPANMGSAPAEATASTDAMSELKKKGAELKQREQLLGDTIKQLQATGSGKDVGASVKGLEHAAEQVQQARAAVEQALALTPTQLQDQMRSSSGPQARYFMESGLQSAPSAYVDARPSVYFDSISPTYPGHLQYDIGSMMSGRSYAPLTPDFNRAAQSQPDQMQQPLEVTNGKTFDPQRQQEQQHATNSRDSEQHQQEQRQLQNLQDKQQLHMREQGLQQQQQQQPQLQGGPREAQQQPISQPTSAPSQQSETQQLLLQKLREAQEDVARMQQTSMARGETPVSMSAATREPARASTEDYSFAPTAGYTYARTAASSPSATHNTGEAGMPLRSSGPSFLVAPSEQPKPHQRSLLW